MNLPTTGIGSLPHTQVDLALQAAFRVDIPYAPQLPRRDLAEQMIPQALEGLPGLAIGADGSCRVDLGAWEAERSAFGDRLAQALDRGLGLLEPSPQAFSAWRPFLWEVEERHVPFAKIHLAGPVTVAHATRLEAGRSVAAEPRLASQVSQLLLCRALAMVAAVRARGAQPLFFFDEPGLCGLDLGLPLHLAELQELRLSVLALRRAGARVGLHCCGNTAWDRLLTLGFDYLSLDARISLGAVLAHPQALAVFENAGGSLCLGVVPTDLAASPGEPRALARELWSVLVSRGAERLLAGALLSPACGLGLRTVPAAAAALERLAELQSILAQRIGVA